MKFYLGMTKSTIELDALFDYDARHSKINHKVAFQIKELKAKKAKMKSDKEIYLKVDLHKAEAAEKQLVYDFKTSEEYVNILNDIEDLKEKENGYLAKISKEKKGSKSKIMTEYYQIHDDRVAKEKLSRQMKKDFYDSDTYKDAIHKIGILKNLRSNYLTAEIEAAVQQIDMLERQKRVALIDDLGKFFDENRGELRARKTNYIPKGKAKENNIDEVIGQSIEGPRTMIDLINPHITYFIRDCYIQKVCDGEYRIVVETPDEGDICIGNFECKQVVDTDIKISR